MYQITDNKREREREGWGRNYKVHNPFFNPHSHFTMSVVSVMPDSTRRECQYKSKQRKEDRQETSQLKNTDPLHPTNKGDMAAGN